MLILQDIIYKHSNGDPLFDGLNLVLQKHDKTALVGNNGSGKSTLLKIASGALRPVQGIVKTSAQPYYVPQLIGQLNDHSVAQALQVDKKLNALKEILDGSVTEENLALLEDDWSIEERCAEAFDRWQLNDLALSQKMGSLSGGQKTKVLLAGIQLHQPETVLLDEPSNHLDMQSRRILYDYISRADETLLVVSHDRTLLNLLSTVYELSSRGIVVYGGNYEFYTGQKAIESEALNNELRNKEKELRKAKETERETMERQQKLDARGKKKQEKAGLPTISMKTFKNNAEKSTARTKGIHEEKISTLSQELTELRKELPGIDTMKMDFDNSKLHEGKTLIKASGINFRYAENFLWKEPLSFRLTSGERKIIQGANGSGKTTLIKILLNELLPSVGKIEMAALKAIYIDQDYTLVDHAQTVYEFAQEFNSGALQEHEIKIRLSRFLFGKEDWYKPCHALSGGERMRLMLCSLAIRNQAPDLILLDEPTNNLDIQNIEILTTAINEYKGTLLVISHDDYFLKQINASDAIVLF